MRMISYYIAFCFEWQIVKTTSVKLGVFPTRRELSGFLNVGYIMDSVMDR